MQLSSKRAQFDWKASVTFLRGGILKLEMHYGFLNMREEEERVGARVEIERPPNTSRHSAWNRVWFPNNCSPEIDERSGIESRNAREPTVTLWGERARQLFKTKYFRVQKGGDKQISTWNTND
ncbi:hypothetical protein TNCV_2649391 [Trichonephila clavipes]|nr:hypothetical protein TNCV_2649391 [Trichonephila clavipes]